MIPFTPKVYFMPIGNQDTASSRLRVWNIQPFIENSVVGIPENYHKGDVLIIQKTPVIDELKKAKKQGAKVIYDIDDRYYKDQKYAEMVERADLVTVDTEEKKKEISRAFVVPDSLDWDGTKKEKYENNGIIGWTGYGNNSQYMNEVEIPKDMNLRLITSSDWGSYYTKEAQSRPWSLAMVDKYLAECDIGVHFLPKRRFEEVKGMHKLLKNWAIGLPTYTSAMPDYVKAMEEAGLGKKYIITEGNQIKQINSKSDIKKARRYAMKYEAKNIAKIWNNIINKVLS